jgi:hypothetical protein
LLEAIAQRWGNIDFGFRELARFPGVGGKAGESIVEAYAWDMESNLKPRMQFTVEHKMKAGGSTKTLTDPRDIYEYVANQAMRRVRKCLEQVIPRDIVEAACEECDRTLKASIKDLGDATKKMLDAFAEFGVTKDAIEARIQRRIEAITPAQLIGLRKIYTSIKDGMSEPADWFAAREAVKSSEEKPQTAADKAKDAMRKQGARAQGKEPPPSNTHAEAPKQEPPPEPAPPVEQEQSDSDHESQPEDVSEAAGESQTEDDGELNDAEGQQLYEQYIESAGQCENLTGLKQLRQHAESNAVLRKHPRWLDKVVREITTAEDVIRKARGARSNG